MLRRRVPLTIVALATGLALVAGACGNGDDDSGAQAPATEQAESSSDAPATEPAAPATSEICDADAIVAAVEGGPAEGTLAGMTDDPVGTAASSNPVLTTLVTAVQAAGLVDTLNSADALTVFAPTDCAFAALDEATLKAALDDPQGLLTQVLGFHVVVGQRLSGDDLAGMSEVTTFTDQTLSVSGDDGTLRVGGQADVVVPDIQTANATVHLIDRVMIPEG